MKKISVAAGLAMLAAVTASAQTRAGGEFQVNTYTEGPQYLGRPAMAPNGDFVIAWTSIGQDGDNHGTFAQRYAASGAPQGGEFLVNTYTTGQQSFPAITMARDSFVVAWSSQDGGLVDAVQARRFDATGTAAGPEFLVNTYSTLRRSDVRIGSAPDGRFVMTWVAAIGPGDDDIFARRYDASGNASGAEFLVNTYQTGRQGLSDIGVGPDGSFVVVWRDYNGRDGSYSSIWGRRFDPTGAAIGGEFLANTSTLGDQRRPAVSVSPAGGFVVVWDDGYMDGSSWGVAARRFDATGAGVGNDFVVNTHTTGTQSGYRNRVAHDAQGNFVIAWNSSQGPGDTDYGSWAQRFSASGARRGGEFLLNTYTTFHQRSPSVASDAVGNFVVVWQSGAFSGPNQDGDLFGVFAQRFGGLVPSALAVDAPGNGVLEPGETVQVHPSWRNVNGATQTMTGTLAALTGPSGAIYTTIDAVGDYGAIADGATAACSDCYAVSVSNPATRPVTHWDAVAVESLLPDTQGQQQGWLLHVGRSFTDVPSTSPFYRFIEALLHDSVTGGCSGTEYCPSTATTREQMAVFVLAARNGTGFVPPACTTPMFPDVPAASPFCRWIEELARRGVVGGCGGGSYCPSSEVTREQMAVFVLRTLDGAVNPPACTTPMYDDVPATSGFCRWIEELTRRGVVSGCGGQSYCPAGPVTREQMGVFIGVTFGLVLYGP